MTTSPDTTEFHELPDARGTYVLVSVVSQMKRMEIGRLGVFEIASGYYAYVGSAFGPGGLRARLEHHIDAVSNPHWHIDYLLESATPVEVWFATSERKLEHDWAELLHEAPLFRAPIPRFGSSDYRRSRTTHLFHSKRRPAFFWFEELIAATYEPRLRVYQVKLQQKEH